ncbi:MAG: hypothetical protein Q9204_001233, partial [Flavoplaca sp. TL-2023a]
LDQSTLVLRGIAEEASSVLLKGTLVLCLAEPLKVHNIRLRFIGERRVSCGGQKKVDQFFRKNWSFNIPGFSRGGSLPADNYEWPFDYILPGHFPESIEGLDDSWIVYRMKATLDRGVLAQDKVIRKHVRVIRTLDSTALELSHEMRIDRTWHDKIDYTLSTPSKGVILGTTIDANFRIAPLLKGLKIGQVTISLVETQDLWMDPKYPERKKGTIKRQVAKDKFDFPQDQETELVDGFDAWVFSRRIALPKSLRQCLQTVDTLGFRTKHNLNIAVHLLNPDEHVSKLSASLPLQIYISPVLLMDDDNTISTNHLGGVDPGAFAVGAPPQYGEHRSDVLFSELDPAGYVTPAGARSGFSTPFDSRSRRGSADNLANLAFASPPASFTPIALSSRLNNLDNATGSDLTSVYPPNVNSSDNPSAALPRQGSDEEADDCNPQHFEYSPERMNKVPSYSTALQSQYQTPINEVPPSYESSNH